MTRGRAGKQVLRVAEMTMTQFARARRKKRTVIIPLGSTEEHGPHLPLDTDDHRAGDCAPGGEDTGALVAPALSYGICTSTALHPGTVGISPDTFRALVRDLIRGFHAQGIISFVLLTGHAGGLHVNAMREAGEEMLFALPDIRVALLSAYDLMKSETADLVETKGDGHAGEMETSCLLAIAPDLVAGTAKKEYPTFPKAILVRKKTRYWKSGVWGDPAKASAAKGREILKRVSSRAAEVVRELERFRE
jgi:creatinine amidohydrolase